MPRSRSSPKFIPAEQAEPGRVYEGYVARKDGLHHWTESPSFDGDPDTPKRAYDPTFAQPAKIDWGVEARRKRTPQERVDSLQQRIASTFLRLGYIPDSVLREVQADQFIRRGKIPSMDDLRMIASLYLRKADQQWNESQSHAVTREDPNAVVPGPTQAPVITESSSVIRKG